MWPIHLLKPTDPEFPEPLKKITHPPKQLYFRGRLDKDLWGKSLAIVGSRRLTHYGQQVIENFMPFLIREKVTTISGFMYGADSEVHRQTLAFGGQTIAILGSGLEVIYPPENRQLYQQILAGHGAIISEYEPNFQPQLWSFPQRNRLVAGLASIGVLIIEAGEQSGSLITARLAQKQGKKVFAIPGPITSAISRGNNLLIQNHHAKMVLTPEDIFDRKAIQKSLFEQNKLSPLEKKITQLLHNEPLLADELAIHLKETITIINQNLSLMALKGVITEVAGQYYLTSSPK